MILICYLQRKHLSSVNILKHVATITKQKAVEFFEDTRITIILIYSCFDENMSESYKMIST